MSTPSRNEDSPRGLGFAMSAYLIWGFLPIYMKQLTGIPALEILAHRVIWSVPVAAALLMVLGRTGDIVTALRTPRMLAMGMVTALLVSVNWGVYVWAITHDNAMDAALGYYINPLFSIFLGAVLLGERPNRLQMVSIGLAGTAVVVLTLENGSLPWVAVSLFVSWGFYGFFKKWLPIGPNQGFLLEVLLLLPFALGYVAWLEARGMSSFVHGSIAVTLLLLGLGLATAVPLILFANGAKLLRMSTIGIMQYVAPTMIFLTAVFVFDEPFGGARAVAFPLIWAALVVYSASLILGMRRRPR